MSHPLYPGSYRLSIAPMMAYTDRHFRYLARLYTKRTLLYTEMVVGTTIEHNLESAYLDKLLGFDPSEHPIAIQLGGDNPRVMAMAARVCADFGYDEINLNVGCPSDRVQKGRFGACLMKEPERVAEVVAAMRAACHLPVTVKHRIGVDERDQYEHLLDFVATVSAAGATHFIGHARKAWLKGLNPAQNRSVPPLEPERIYQLKRDFPHLTIAINGGVLDLEMAEAHLKQVDGVMIGRAAYAKPELFAEADARFFAEPSQAPPDPKEVLAHYSAYAREQIARGEKASWMLKHLVGLFKSQPGARLWRQGISQLVENNAKDFDLAKLYEQTIGVAGVLP